MSTFTTSILFCGEKVTLFWSRTRLIKGITLCGTDSIYYEDCKTTTWGSDNCLVCTCRFRTFCMLQALRLRLYFCPLRATVVYQESLNHARNRTRMIDSWLCSGFSFCQVNNNNNNNNKNSPPR